MHGSGVVIYANDDKYEGDWLNGKKHGEGVYTWADGKILKGTILNDEPAIGSDIEK